MAEVETKEEPTKTDIFKQQEKTITLLQDVLEAKAFESAQPVYVTQAEPAKEPPNYMMYIAVFGGLYFLTR